MNGFAMAFSPCLVCHQLFSYNPRLVPSHQGEPICRHCITVVNRKRRELGNPEWPVHDDAYSPCPEHEL